MAHRGASQQEEVLIPGIMWKQFDFASQKNS